MSSTLSRTIIIFTSISAGILTLGYFFIFRRKKKFKKNKKQLKSDEGEKDMSILSNKNKSQKNNRTSFEVTTSASLELNKKNELAISKQINFFVEKICEKMTKEDNKTKKHNHSGSIELGPNRVQKYTDATKKYREQDEEGENSSQEKINMYKKKKPVHKTSIKEYTKDTEDQTDFRKSTTTRKISLNQNNTILNIVNDLKFVDLINNNMKHFSKESNNQQNFDNQASLYLPILTNDIDDEIDMNSEAGYIEDDDEDFKDIDGPLVNISINELNIQGDLSDFVERRTGKNNLNNVQLNQEKIEKIETAEDLDIVLSARSEAKNININYNILTELRYISDSEKVEIIKEELLLTILKYLYNELHSGLIELSDKFVEQRRYYFEADQATYVSIINLFLRKKEEYFLGVLSEIMSRLTISQTLLDNTFVFYMNYANQEDTLVQQIKEAYDKVYKAGIKTTIAPRNLNKIKLKEIIQFQVEKYAELMKQFKDMDMIEVMVIDYTYLEYGFDREAIKAAMSKHNVFESESFEVYLKKLDDYQKNSFLNI